MTAAVVTAILTFLLTGLIANRLVQRWQYRNWVSQQRLADREKEYGIIQDLFDEIALLSSKRQHKMFRLVSSLRTGNLEVVRARFADYDSIVVEWNERLNAIFAKLTMYLRWRFTKQFEDEIQGKFVSIGRELETLTYSKLRGEALNSRSCARLQNELNKLQGRLFLFNRDVLRFLLDKKSSLYREMPFVEETLDRFPTWELFKALFKPGILRPDVNGSTGDFGNPDIGRL